MWFQTSAPDPFTTVSSTIPGYHYLCVDVAAVDEHITLLAAICGPSSNLAPARLAGFRRDIDNLLLRRRYLSLMAEAA